MLAFKPRFVSRYKLNLDLEIGDEFQCPRVKSKCFYFEISLLDPNTEPSIAGGCNLQNAE